MSTCRGLCTQGSLCAVDLIYLPYTRSNKCVKSSECESIKGSAFKTKYHDCTAIARAVCIADSPDINRTCYQARKAPDWTVSFIGWIEDFMHELRAFWFPKTPFRCAYEIGVTLALAKTAERSSGEADTSSLSFTSHFGLYVYVEFQSQTITSERVSDTTVDSSQTANSASSRTATSATSASYYFR